LGDYNGKKVAVKKIYHKKFTQSEVDSNNQFQHENVLNYFYHEKSKDSHVYIALDHYEGSLSDLIDLIKDPYTFKDDGTKKGLVTLYNLKRKAFGGVRFA